MALIRTAWVLAALALAFAIVWAATMAPPDTAAGLIPFAVALVGAVAIAGTTSYVISRQRGRTSMAPLVTAAVISVAIPLGMVLWPLVVPVTLLLCAYSVDQLRRVRNPSKPSGAG